MNQETMDRVAEILKHPFAARRKTDTQLARAALTGHLGLQRMRGVSHLVGAGPDGSLSDGIDAVGPSGLLRLWSTLTVLSRRWFLRRRMQVDQGDTPWCVDATRCHWQLSLPVYGLLTHPLGSLYDLCKQIDPWPGEEGTAAPYMLQVCQELGLVESSWWYSGPEDAEAALRWLTEVGGLWFGASWPESAFRTRILADGTTDGLIEVGEEPWQWGHETYLIGRSRNYKRQGPCIEGVQSWGEENYGVRGRFWIKEQEFFDKWMHPSYGWGDLVGVVEKAA